MRVVFMGTPDFAVPALRALAAAHEVVCVYTQPPRPAGRGKKDRKTAVHLAAEALGLPVRHPASLKDGEAQAAFVALGADLAVVVAYGLLLPGAILAAPKRGCLNIHASLLPRWRGAAPIHRAIMAGDRETGIAIMQMDAGLDTGAVLVTEPTAIGATETTGDLHDRLAVMGAALIVTALASIDRLTPKPQPAEGVTYATKIDKAEARIDWHQPAVTVDRQIRGLSPFPGAWCEAMPAGPAVADLTPAGAALRVKLLRSRLAPGTGRPGTLLGGFTVACGIGAVEILEAQREGRRPAPADEFLRGLPLAGLA